MQFNNLFVAISLLSIAAAQLPEKGTTDKLNGPAPQA
jgi:hypothetical protein